MARVTIEDCIEKIGSHFKVAQIASHRAHQLELGEKPTIDKENDKPIVIALREIAEGNIDEKILSKPLAEKEWNQDSGLLAQPSDIGQAIADIDSYGDINEVEPEVAKSEQAQQSVAAEKGAVDSVQELDLEADEGSETGKA